MELARVTPIFKDGYKDDKSNYRPISVLPAISPLFEKLITDQLYQFMDTNGLFSTNKCGFLSLHSTLMSLLKSTADWYRGLDLGELVGLVFIDLKKLLIQLTTAFSAKSYSIMMCVRVNFPGLNFTCPTENSFVG